MSATRLEFGATRGIYMGWTDVDQGYAREQQARMDAQRTLGSNVLSLTSERITIPHTWADMSADQRQIIAALESGEIDEETAVFHLESLELSKSE